MLYDGAHWAVLCVVTCSTMVRTGRCFVLCCVVLCVSYCIGHVGLLIALKLLAGKPFPLEPAAEEVAGFYSAMLTVWIYPVLFPAQRGIRLSLHTRPTSPSCPIFCRSQVKFFDLTAAHIYIL
jgi:hypothetical protein